MSERNWKLFGVITIIIAVITLFFHWQWTTGYLVGTAIAVINYMRNESYWGDILDEGTVKGSRYGFHFTVNMFLMAVPMVVAALFPQYLNIFTVALGEMMIKITVTVEVLLPKGGNAN